MPKFNYIAKESTGHTVKGEIEVPDKKHALDILRSKNLLILKLEESTEKKPLFSTFKLFGKKKIAMDELVVFARQMATMTAAGITIVNALDTLAEQVGNIELKRVLQEVRDAVNTGSSLSEAMNKYSNIFSEYFINMVRAGESSGKLDEVLERVSSYLEKTNKLQKKIKSAMIYPAVVTSMAVIITLVMILKVIPVFKDMFSDFGADLPAPTQFLINLSELAQKYFFLFFLFFVIIVIAARVYAATDRGKFAIDALKLKLPVFGMLFKKVATSRFTRTLATLVKSGVPILSALEIVAKTSGNLVVEKSINKVRESVREGESIADPLERSGVFPPIVIRMVSVGEKSGELETMLTKIADFFDDQVDVVVEGMTSLIEPLIIAFLGIVIGGIVICMFLPIFKISTLIQF